MAKLVALRVPEILLSRIDAQGPNRSETILKAVRLMLDGTSPTPKPRAIAQPVIDDPRLAAAVEIEEEPETPQCAYTEFIPETGETLRCRLTIHSGKIKHQPGEVVG